MVESVMPLEGIEELAAPTEEQAVIETESGVYIVEVWEGETSEVFTYLQQINEQWIESELPEMFTTFVEGHKFVFFSNELIDREIEIQELYQQLEPPKSQEGKQTKESAPLNEAAPEARFTIDVRSERPIVYDRHPVSSSAPKPEGLVPKSIFSLATKVHQEEKAKPKAQRDGTISVIVDAEKQEEIRHLRLRQDQLGYRKEEQGEDDRPKDQRQKWEAAVSAVDANKKSDEVLEGMENIYIRFMALMARILGQAEAEAHSLYNKIKARTDQIDLLTQLVQKINAAPGGIDWENDQEMRKIIDNARACGVEIPPGKYSWGEDEKILFKENVQMKKDSMEKITQLERTDMQRYLQEASQCHQARSNILKLLKEVLDTIIYNLRS